MMLKKQQIILLVGGLLLVGGAVIFYTQTQKNTAKNNITQQGSTPVSMSQNPSKTVVGNDTMPPHKVTNLKSSTISDQEIKLIWAPTNDNNKVAHYIIYRSEGDAASGGNSGENFQSKPVTGTEYRDTNLKSLTSYYYYVKAVDEKGNESEASNITGAKTKRTDPAENMVTGNLSGELGIIIPDATIIVTIQDKNDPTKKVADPYRVRLVNKTGSYQFRNLPTKVYLLTAKTEENTPLYQSVQIQHTATFPTKADIGDTYGKETLKKSFNFKKVDQITP